MPGGQFSHFRDKMSLARDTGHRGSIPGRTRPFQDGWQAYGMFYFCCRIQIRPDTRWGDILVSSVEKYVQIHNTAYCSTWHQTTAAVNRARPSSHGRCRQLL